MVSKQSSIRGLLGLTTLCAGALAAYQYGSLRAFGYYVSTVYVLLPVILAAMSTRKFTDDWSLLLIPAVLSTFIVLLCVNWAGLNVVIGLVNLGPLIVWPAAIMVIVGFQRGLTL